MSTTDFRSQFLDHDSITRQLAAWAAEHPQFVRVRSIGRSEEGRDILCVVIGAEPDVARPAIWIDGNMHASELSGSSVALAIAEDAIRLHAEPGSRPHGLPAHVAETLRGVQFHVVPRMSPDGAEAVLKTGRYVRSVPRDRRPNRGHSRWIGGDVDGDGLALLMRKEDPTGEFVELAGGRGMLVPRSLEDAGPYYKLYPEGTIESYDGFTIPSPSLLADNEPDLNRNFPYSWAPEPEQEGAGAFPGSEPESRAVIEAATKTPTLFAWINFHTFGGVFIRPLGDKPDSKMDQGDLAVFRQLAEWGDALTGYPTVSGYEEFLYEPEKPLRGDLTDFAHHQRGCLAVACEIWDLFTRAGIEKKKRFVDYYTHLTREDFAKLARWDAEHNGSQAIRGWRKADHPQLGPVELGGIDPRFGFWNPPSSLLPEICAQLSAWVMRVAALAPVLVMSRPRVTPLGGGLTRLEVTVENRGYLPTYVLSSARHLPWNEPLTLEVSAEGAELTSQAEARHQLGHLDGWGRGLYDGTSALYHARSRGSTSVRTASCVVRGRGRITLRAGSCRVGFVEETVELG